MYYFIYLVVVHKEMLQGKLNGRANGADFDVAKTGVRIWILIDWTGTVGFEVQPGH